MGRDAGRPLPPLESERSLPSISTYGDGLVLVPRPVPGIFPGPAGYALDAVRIDADLLDEIVASALGIGLRGADRRIEQEGPEFVVDGGATVITVVANGGRHVTVADALFDAPASSQERGLLSGFVSRLLELQKSASGVAPYEPTSAAVYVAALDPGFGPEVGSEPDVPWPFAEPIVMWGEPRPADGLSVDVRCAIIRGAEFSAALPALLEATATTPFVDGAGDRRILAWRPSFPTRGIADVPGIPSRPANVFQEMRMLVPVAALVLVAVSACVVNDPPEAFLGPEPPSIQVDPPFSDPGLNISAYAYCWGTACVDGEPPYERYQLQLPGPGAVELQPIGLADWSYQASAMAASDPTGEAIPLELTPAHVELFSTRIRHLLVSFPDAGEWDVNLTGRGPQGDAAYAFQVTVGEAP